MERMAIIGLGLMGGSLGLAAKRARLADEVRGYARRDDNRRRALALRAVDRVFDTPDMAAAGAEMVVFCVPVLAMLDIMKVVRPALARNCLVTDVGSTKGDLAVEARRLLRGSPAHFIGSHPMAGSDQTGIAFARGDLYHGATVIVTPMDRKERSSTHSQRLQTFWRALGSSVIVLPPREHDRLIARTSHLPHVVAAALVANLHREGGETVRRLVGPGFMDTTRVAGGSEDMWHDIVKSNSEALSRELKAFGEQIDALRRLIDGGEFDAVRRFLATCRTQRKRMEVFRG